MNKMQVVFNTTAVVPEKSVSEKGQTTDVGMIISWHSLHDLGADAPSMDGPNRRRQQLEYLS